MDTTLTIRLPVAQRKALQRRAAAARKSESALVREMIEREMHSGLDFERVRHLLGSVSSDSKPRRPSRWREHLRARNWRP